jgi:hypothetical protein
LDAKFAKPKKENSKLNWYEWYWKGKTTKRS